jgi:hypothetical protein
MDENRYNTRVRHAMSDNLVECRKMKCNFESRITWINKHLIEEKDTITHREYMRLSTELIELEEKIERLKVVIDVWDQARELCMNIADEMCKEMSER